NAYSRTLYGRTQYNRPSRFLEEIEAKRVMKQGAAANLQKAPARTFVPKVFKPSVSKPDYTQPATKSVSNKVASDGEKV
ncbi:DNA helicase PcrA, partial [Enterococcus faecalis]